MGNAGGLALHPFLDRHPPAPDVQPAGGDLLDAYRGVLPDSLLELWAERGLGFYGERQIALIDPRAWQATLDRWIVTEPDDDVQRIPIALTPFGSLLYYRKLTATDEDVACLDPITKAMSDLAWSLEDFFNGTLCSDELLDDLIPPELAETATRERGPLADGEVYHVDPMLLTMQMLRVEKADALHLHARLRDEVDPRQPKDDPPRTVGEAVPAPERAACEGIGAAGLTGLYLSSYIDWHRLLALQPDGAYRLVFWQIDPETFERVDVRVYAGGYRIERSPAGDDLVSLDIELRDDSLGSDARDERLIAVHDAAGTWLLRRDRLADIAGAIEGRGRMGSSEDFFRRVTLEDAWPAGPGDDCPPPPAATWPAALRASIRDEALRITITHVEEPGDDDDTIMCTLDLGTNDGLRMNMPLYSPAESGRGLKGWVWRLDPHACKAGIRFRRRADGSIEHGPAVGDVLTNRRPPRVT